MKVIVIALLSSMIIMGCSEPDQQQSESLAEDTMKLNLETPAPQAKKVPHPLTAHGITRTDNYYWMRDDERKNSEVLAHLEKENAYLENVLAPLADTRESLYEELVSRVPKDDSTVPVLDNGYWYYTQYSGDNEYPIFIRKPTLDAEDETLLDVNELAKGHDYFSVGTVAVSRNNAILAYSEDTVSRRLYTIKLRNIDTGEYYSDTISETSGGIVWANDNTHFFYVKKDPQTLLGYQVYRHKIGTTQADDVLVYEEDDDTFYTYLGKSKDDDVIYVFHSNTDMTGTTLIDANAPTKPTRIFLPIEHGVEYDIAKSGDSYFVLTNKDAQNFKVMRAPASATDDVSQWEEVVAHNPDVFIQDMEVVGDFLVLKEKENGEQRLVAHNLNTNVVKTIPMEDPIFGVYFTGNTQTNTDTLRIYYSSLTTPPSTLDINLVTLDTKVMKQNKVSEDFDASQYRSERVMILARDGKKVPVSLVYKKSTFAKDGTNPLYQYAYGSYGSTVEPTFSTSWVSLLDRGFVVAIAHVRGGQMLGRAWYEDGKMHAKTNTFTDFIDVSKGLVAMNYADGDNVFAMGGSAGGLLMGAIVNMAPELYKGVSAHVPFVDVVTTMSDASIPLTTGEYTEWGNPANKDEFDYMLSYSPYDQVKAQAYPNMLVTTGLHDSQVQYFEPMKWVAKLRELKTDDNLLLFQTDMEAGHGGASGRFKRYESKALEYAFVLYLAGKLEKKMN